MSEESFAAVGMFATFVVAVLLLGAVVILIVSSVKEWLNTKRGLTCSTSNLLRVQRVLIEANNNLNERVKALEENGTCSIEEDKDTGMFVCSDCGAVQPEDHTVYYCWSCGAKVVEE